MKSHKSEPDRWPPRMSLPQMLLPKLRGPTRLSKRARHNGPGADGSILGPIPCSYNSADHFDHPVDLTDQEAFRFGSQHLVSERNWVIADLQQGCNGMSDTPGETPVEAALDHLGRALHALQDAYSHSNYVDGLPASEQAQFDAALLDGTAPLPSDLKMTLYDFASDPEDPTGTCTPDDSTVYCHEYWSKDFLNKNKESQVWYYSALDAAIRASANFMQGIIEAVGAGVWDQEVANYDKGNGGCGCPVQPGFAIPRLSVTSNDNSPCNGGSGGGGSGGGGGGGSPCPMCPGGTNGGGPGGGPAGLSGQVITSGDPNDKAGSLGVGTQQYISGDTPLRYAVQFGNEPTASANARTVTITDQLNLTDENLSTFNLGPISFLSQIVFPPPGPSDFSTSVDLGTTPDLLVAVHTHLDQSTGLLNYTFQTLDRTTNQPPADPSLGFLPPGGIGSVFFTVVPMQGLTTNTQVQNQATVVFDANQPINTPTWLNTLDNTPPTSTCSATALQRATCRLHGELVGHRSRLRHGYVRDLRFE